MKFWTVQKQSVIDEVLETGIFYPDYKESNFVKENPQLLELYKLVTDSFNEVNNTQFSGVIFTFFDTDGNNILYYNNIEEFTAAIKYKKASIEALWKKFSPDEYVIVELEFEPEFNPIFIDINDFQFLMPPLAPLPPYTESDIIRLLQEIREGIISPSVFPSYLIQGHIPFIAKEHIVGLHPMFEI